MTGQMTNYNGVPLMTPNDVTIHKGFHISYNDRDNSVYGSDTTALVVGNMEKFLILNGNHVKAYQDIGDNLDMALDYFKNHRNQINKHSDAA